ncbi:hypothetical protein BJX61DRAFT_546775 [Aspergillus egyptiacus]|nr:hypothetical protein BJX61DRAFT_546775 [Aspergillus egyptiacus]
MAPLTTLPELLTFSLLLLSSWRAIHLYVKENGPLATARIITRFHNGFYAAVSLIMLIQILLLDFTTTTTNNGTSLPNKDDDKSSFTPRYTFHLSKFYESLDILLLSAAGIPISNPLAFHHLTTPYLTYIRYIAHHRGWRPFALTNNFHHVLVYTFFASPRGGRASARLRLLVPFTGVLQLIVSVWVDLNVGLDKYHAYYPLETKSKAEAGSGGEEPYWPNLVSLALVGAYFVLFFQGFGWRVPVKMALWGALLGILLGGRWLAGCSV